MRAFSGRGRSGHLVGGAEGVCVCKLYFGCCVVWWPTGVEEGSFDVGLTAAADSLRLAHFLTTAGRVS